MKTNFFLLVASLFLIAGTATAQENGFSKGLYIHIDAGSDAIFDNAIPATETIDRVPMKDPSLIENMGVDLNASVIAGYRFCPQLVVGGGTGGYVTLRTDIETFSLPLFIHLRSDFLDARVSPFASLDLGYAFMIPTSLASYDSIGTVIQTDKLASGNQEYTNYCCDTIRDGVFANFDLGVSWKVKDSRMDFAVGCGVAECFRGTLIYDEDGKIQKFGYREYNGSRIVFSHGSVTEAFKDRLHLALQFKLGLEF